MATNEILPFAENGIDGTDVLSQSDYNSDSQRLVGHQPGIARQKLANKAMRQASIIAAAVAQFMADNQANDIVDTETAANLASYLETAIGSLAGGVASTAEAQAWTDNTKRITPLRLAEAFQGANQTLAATGKQNLPGGLLFKWNYAAVAIPANSGVDVTFPTAFPNACFGVLLAFTTAADGDDGGPTYRNISASGFRLMNSLTGSITGYFYLAIGY